MPQLYDFQYAGLNHLLTPMPSGKRAKLLAWDMGTGKTPIACTALVKISAQNALIICPAGEVKTQWAVKLVEWGVCDWSAIYIVDSRSDAIPASARFIIANFEQLLSNFVWKQLYKRSYDAIIVDEAQRVKDIKARVTKRLFGQGKKNSRPPLIARGKWKWFLSGTITPNVRPIELFPVLRTMVPELLEPYLRLERYIKRWCGWKGRGASHVDEFRERTKDFIHHVKLKDVYKELPDIAHSEVYFDLGLSDDEHEEIHRVMELATARKTLGDLITPHAIGYLKQRLEDKPEEKIVVFAWTRSVIESIHEAFPGVAVKYYGGMSKDEKHQAKFRFINSAKIKLFIAQIRTGGTGVDGLQSVSYNTVKVEPDWTPGDDDQTTARLLRIGQRKDVHETRLLALNTLHETIHWNRKNKNKFNIISTSDIGVNQMSLEQQLEANTKALIALTEVLSKNGATAAPGTAAKNTTDTTSGVSAKGATATKEKAEKAAPKSKSKLDRDDVRALASKTMETLSGGGPPTVEAKTKVKGLLQEIGGVGKIDDLDASKFESFVQALNAALEENEGNETPPADDLEV